MLSAKLGQVLGGRPVVLEDVVDRAMLGGFIVESGSLVLDGGLEGQLERMRHRLALVRTDRADTEVHLPGAVRGDRYPRQLGVEATHADIVFPALAWKHGEVRLASAPAPPSCGGSSRGPARTVPRSFHDDSAAPVAAESLRFTPEFSPTRFAPCHRDTP